MKYDKVEKCLTLWQGDRKINMKLPQISSITDGPRQTNMELLRIVAMVLVMTVHADFVALGASDRSPETVYGMLSSVTRTMIEMGAMVCVNVFILISGWFGIKAGVKGFLNFAFQCLFFLVFTYVLWLAESGAQLSAKGVMSCLCLTESNWFIKAYMALFILSPMLNVFAEKAGKRGLKIFLILFFAYETVWGWLGVNNSVDRGYTAFSFTGLYLLARYMRLYFDGKTERGWLALYIVTVLLDTAGYYVLPGELNLLSYVNPLVTAGSLGLFMWFTTLRMKFNFVINFVAQSAFGAYLLHAAPKGMYRFKELVVDAFNVSEGPFCILAVGGVIAGFFVAAVLIDQIRLLLWHCWVVRSVEPVRRWFNGCIVGRKVQ